MGKLSYILSIILLLTSASHLSAQQKSKNNKPIELKNGFRGLATYQYTTKDSVELKNGRFSFKGNKSDLSDWGQISQFSASGNYLNNLKNGVWNFELSHYLVVLTEIVQHQPKTNTTGSQISLQANYIQGKANGKWTITEDKIENNKIIPSVSSTQAEFSQGYFINRFSHKGRYKGMPYSISGSFSKEGFLHGNWIIEFNNVDQNWIEKRTYDDGFLLYYSLQEKNAKKVEIEVDYDDVKKYLTRLKSKNDIAPPYSIGKDRYEIGFDNGYTADSPKRQVQKNGNNLLHNAFQLFTNSSMMFYQISGDSPIVSPATRRFIYELSPSESDALQQAKLLTDTLCSTIDYYLKNPSFKLNYKRSDSLSFTYELLHIIAKKAAIVQEEIAHIEDPAFKIINPVNYYEKGIPELDSMIIVAYEFDNKEITKQVNINTQVDDGKSISIKLLMYTEQMELLMRNIQPFLNATFVQFGKEKEIEEKEEKIVSLLEELAHLYSSENYISANGKQLPAQVFDSIYTHLAIIDYERKMEKYIVITDLEDRKNQAKKIISALESIKQIHAQLKEILEYKERLDIAFTKYTYNPYTGKNDLKERAKKRLYQKAVEELLPILIKELEEEKSTEIAQEKTNTIVHLYNRLLELVKLSDKETRKLEKKLRKESDPERIKRLLDL
ncbi:MAG: hypothetical protein ACK4K0_12300 [Flavobacteriales bacterium]